jgi:arylsulfatase A-like enzyme
MLPRALRTASRFFTAWLLVGFTILAHPLLAADPAEEPPNVVLLFVDDLGYADVGCFGGDSDLTPNLDQMAREGRRFTDFVVSSPVCSASRAALMTGCIHERIGIFGALGPQSKIGINDGETTMAELLKGRGYRTACIGKWHLGHHPQFLPTRHGFDSYFGLPYSNDMWPFHPDVVNLPPDAPQRRNGFPPLPLFENETVVDADVTAEDQVSLTEQYTQRAEAFLEASAGKGPFFLYVPYTMVHVPLFAGKPFQGTSPRGPFGDVLREVDASVGRILQKLKDLHVDDNTLVFFTSDNGPWLSYGSHAGSAGVFREGKGTCWEGGMRVPLIARWPRQIPADTTCDRLASIIDLFPTIATLTGTQVPNLPIDGKPLGSLLSGDANGPSPHTSLPYYFLNNELHAVRTERWKLVLPHRYRSLQGRQGRDDGMPIAYDTLEAPLSLFDLEQDPSETTNCIADYPEVAQLLQEEAARWRSALGDSLTKTSGSQRRAAGQLVAP